MGLFSRKKASVKVSEDRELISTNEKSFEALVALAGENEEYKQKLRRLQEKVKFLTPAEGVKDYDKKIRNAIEDLRIILVKAAGEELPKKAESALVNIEVIISDRNAHL